MKSQASGLAHVNPHCRTASNRQISRISPKSSRGHFWHRARPMAETILIVSILPHVQETENRADIGESSPDREYPRLILQQTSSTQLHKFGLNIASDRPAAKCDTGSNYVDMPLPTTAHSARQDIHTMPSPNLANIPGTLALNAGDLRFAYAGLAPLHSMDSLSARFLASTNEPPLQGSLNMAYSTSRFDDLASDPSSTALRDDFTSWSFHEPGNTHNNFVPWKHKPL